MKHLLAYLDPGAGSMLIQSIIGGVLGLAYAGRKTLHRVIGALRKKDSTEKS
ncbi:MAG TPA: hypothetical protein VMT30_03010 [Candidatus Saccharimonadia bacterium]|nr:hypothetical protein [Candidatus Saccharimonadia bacterium]